MAALRVKARARQTLYKRPLYNSQTDFTPVALLAQVPILLLTRKDLPAKDFKEFLAYVKANKDKVTYANAGIGAGIAARPGYPTVIVPFGLLTVVPPQNAPFPQGFTPKPAPFGVGFVGAQCSEPTLIEIAYAFEQASKKRVPPATW